MSDDAFDQLAARRAAKHPESRNRTAAEWEAAAVDMARTLQAIIMFSEAALARPITKVSTLAQVCDDLAAHVLLKHGFPTREDTPVGHVDNS